MAKPVIRMPTVLKDSGELIQILESLELPSTDVTALYPNIDIKKALIALDLYYFGHRNWIGLLRSSSSRGPGCSKPDSRINTNRALNNLGPVIQRKCMSEEQKETDRSLAYLLIHIINSTRDLVDTRAPIREFWYKKLPWKL